MTRFSIGAIAIMAAAALTACVDRPNAPAEPANTAHLPLEAAPSVTGQLHELPVVQDDASAFPLAPGSFVTGSFRTPESGQLVSIAVQIGNYANTSDGALAVEACQQGRCAQGEKALEGSVDNGYLDIPLPSPIPVIVDESITYRIVKTEGVSPVALWLYTPNDSLSALEVNDQTSLERTPKIAIRLTP